MISRLVFLLFCGHIALNLGNAQKLPRGQNLKVQINTTDDTICMKYLRLIPNTKLHGFILGYGSSFFSNQYIPLPSEGKSYVTEVDAEPRYLITVRAAPIPNHRKTCSGKTKTQKPLQLVVGTLTPNSVFLSWGILVNPQHDWTATSSCASDRFYTVRYREKDKNKKWGFQLCPTTETVVDNLKPNTLYEFGVKDNTEDGIWSKIFNHKTILSNKNKGNGHLQNTYKFIPNSQTQFIPGDGTKRVPITRIKQVIQNITHRILPKATDRPSLAGAILVHLIIPGLNETPPKFPKTLGMFETPKKKLIMNETQMWPAESKTPKVQEISPQSFPATIESFQEGIKPTVPAASEKSEISPDYNESELESTEPNIAPTPELPLNILAHSETDSGLEETNSTPKPELAQTQNILAPKETRRVPLKPKPSPKPHVPQTKPALESTTFRTEQAKTPLAPKEVRRVPSKPKISPSPDVPQTKPAPKETWRVPSKPKTSPIPDTPPTKAAVKEIRRVTSRPKTSPSPEIPPTKPVPKEIQRIPSKLKTSASPDVPHSKPGIIPSIQEPVTATAPYSLERAKATLAPKEIRLIPSKPKASVRPEVLQTKPVPNETYQISFKPQTALTTENPQLKTAPHKVHLTPARPKISDKPQTRTVLNKTTPGPGRTKTAGVVRWGGTPTEVVQDSTKFLTGSNISLESNVTRKKLDSVIPPDGRRPPVAPARPTQVRRKPLPPNTVTGKPGSPGISSTSRASASSTTSVVRPTGPTKPLKTEKPRKKPTVSASPEESVNTTVFSSSPTSETDVQGQPRFKAPYVVYMPKGDNEPCSITSTLEHFPEEEASNKEDAANPPQNPPSNLTVVTVEGCPSFVVLNWTKPENDTVTEYKVVSTENGAPNGKEMSILTTNQTHSTVENLKPNTSYEFHVKAINPSGEGPPSDKVIFDTESADPRVSEPISMGKDAIWTEIPFNSNSYSECKGKQYVKRTWYKKFVGVQLCNSLRYKIYLSDSLTGKFYSIGDQRGHGEDHCQFVDSFLDGRTGQQVSSDQLPMEDGFFRAVRQEPVKFGKIGGSTHINYVHWYECGTSIPGKW